MDVAQTITTSPDDATEPLSTRERILDVAMDLFIEQGFDRTSLREIAGQLGVTKAALYYHFASKDDILMALHMRFHEFGKDALALLTDQEPSVELWRELLDAMVEQMLNSRKIFMLHERNQAAFEKLHSKEHEVSHEDLQERFRKLLGDQRFAARDRVRMAASFGAVMAGIAIAGEAFDDIPSEDLAGYLRGAVNSLLR
jgi:AcrR family transcriptional regulator